ncbi:DUF4405 domain-containing protein [Gluconobacter sphaericus]|uniref:DUF4405 domain-containing protein n=1 Tax=Gluconobacter sphaericus NBRC 12467 TaxID=1307951 RepID=A0AA37SDX6_9PROT|nr:DUF4405 domain-containing protein [Gluconobacter sphaericus]MBF0885158.1 DUF4405 domain-containing protein [Gluconobacter sphaericus]MBS1085924.1 DUF4405 domain-containing protein [Gluconobacter sphaericus]MBS1099680.1 DUF4405 domain-containing protein [Gluconobacter sphaericus]GBR51092.1 hypothetical protein AA12467_0481 [Gluconobacter sphaericus NBRC 12467]GEB41966.1 hypothetical protein GSP01_07480 [Gluconobacter sphaericus NBRC 12467]
MFKTFMNRYGTPLTTGFFIVSGVTGVAMFFHWAPQSFHPIHEWLSMVLLAPFILHLVKNWTSLVNYARRKTLYVPLIIAFAACIPFIFQVPGGHAGNRKTAFMALPVLEQAPLSDIAPLVHMDADGLIHRLQSQGYTVISAEQSLDDIAKTSGRPVNDTVVAALQRPHDHSGHQD